MSRVVLPLAGLISYFSVRRSTPVRPAGVNFTGPLILPSDSLGQVSLAPAMPWLDGPWR